MSYNQLKSLRGKKPSPPNTCPTLPEIFVTETKDTMESHGFPPVHNHDNPSTRRIPKVQLIGNHGNSTVSPDIRTGKVELYDEIIAILQDGFHLQNGKIRHTRTNQTSRIQPTGSKGQRSNKQRHQEQYDVCVYLFTHSTIADSECFHKLFVALARKIPIVFIKSHNDELPPTFAESVRRNSHGCTSLSEYINKFVRDSHASLSKQSVSKRKLIQPNQRQLPSLTRSQPKSNSDLNIRGVDIRKIRKLQVQGECDDDCDLILFLLHCYKNAFIFDVNEKQRCAEFLKRNVHNFAEVYHGASPNVVNSFRDEFHSQHCANGSGVERQVPEENQSDIHLRVPESKTAVSTREWGTSGSISAPPVYNPPTDGRYSYNFRAVSPLPIEEKTTTYLIFTNEHSTDKVRMVNYPAKTEDIKDLPNTCNNDFDTDEFDPWNSPIQITDIDLGRDVNKVIDAFENDMYD